MTEAEQLAANADFELHFGEAPAARMFPVSFRDWNSRRQGYRDCYAKYLKERNGLEFEREEATAAAPTPPSAPIDDDILTRMRDWCKEIATGPHDCIDRELWERRAQICKDLLK